MIFRDTELSGACVIELDMHEDERGYFARTWCQNEFEAHGLTAQMVQANTSFNGKAGTLRGMHYQVPPYQEAKLVRCTRGALYDVIIDLRSESVTYKHWVAVELSAENGTMLYIPKDFAHGFMTLEDNTEVSYLMSEFYTPGSGAGLRWDEPSIGIQWPREVDAISLQDASWPEFSG